MQAEVVSAANDTKLLLIIMEPQIYIIDDVDDDVNQYGKYVP